MRDEEKGIDGANLKALLDFLDRTPENLLRFTDGLSAAELCLKNSESEFSVLENICHLRDLELQGYTPRIRRMLDEVEPVLPDFDGARVAAESNYHSERVDRALETFAAARRDNIQTLRTLTQEQLSHEGFLEGVGKVTVRRVADMMREHDEGHLDDLRVLRQRLERSRGVGEGGN